MKTTITLLITVLIALAGFGQTATPPAGDGTETIPYQIDNLDNLYWLSQNPSEWSAYYIQTSDINASETYGWDSDSGFSPIGIYNTNFTGSYDGQGHIIDSLFINRPGTDYIGLFGYVSSTEAKIQQLGVSNANITGNMYTGALLGNLWEGNVNNCYSTGSVNAESDRTGGLIGQIINGSVENCYSKSVITGHDFTGGLAGLIWDNGVLTNSYSKGTVSGSTVGGLVGNNKGIVEYSFWDTLASGQATSAGGTPKTTAELMDICMYISEGNWDFLDETKNGTNDYWGMNSEKNEGYPFLAWQGFNNAGDEIKPSVITKDTIFFLDETGMALLKEKDVIKSASDNCGLSDTTLSQLAFSCDDTGEITIGVTVTDRNGNDTTGQSVITIEDTIKPTLSTTDITVTLDKNGQASITPSELVTNASDNCSIVDTVISQTEFTNDDLGDVTVNITVEDGSGNTFIGSAVITVNEEETGLKTIAWQEVKIYPNPANGFVYIDTEIKNLKVTIININGKRMYKGFIDKSSNKLEISSFPPGPYIIKIEDDENLINHKLMIK